MCTGNAQQTIRQKAETLRIDNSMLHDNRSAQLLAAVFAAIFILVAWDLIADSADGVETMHVVIEGAVLALSGTGFGWLAVRMLRQRKRMRVLARDLGRARRDAERWRDRYGETLRGLAAAISAQFNDWGLSEAETEVAMLLLKGLSLREIAQARGTGERTVRDQARAVYRKAGLPNRSALAAFFLEDLLLPMDQRG